MKFRFAPLLLLALTGCSYLGIGAQAVKDTLPAGQQVGTFKVGSPYQVGGQWYYPRETYSYDETGIASWYGPGFHGGRTANGERYSQRELTAAHRTLQMPSFVRVTNLANGRSVVVRINDRGPFAKGRVIDVSEKAAELLDFKRYGVARVRVQLLPEASRQIAQAAREGRSWHGSLPDDTLVASTYQSPLPAPTAVSPARPYELDGQPVPAHAVGGAYYPDPVVVQQPVAAATSLYIQAGSFNQAGNAERLAHRLSSYARSYVADTEVNGATYHRVRMGPFPSISEADRMLAQISALAPDARIVVD